MTPRTCAKASPLASAAAALAAMASAAAASPYHVDVCNVTLVFPQQFGFVKITGLLSMSRHSKTGQWAELGSKIGALALVVSDT